jgi:hypothetical protein
LKGKRKKSEKMMMKTTNLTSATGTAGAVEAS